MDRINGVNGAGHLGPIQPVQPGKAGGIPGARQPSVPSDDTVEISDHGQFMSRMAELPDIRQERVETVKAAIQEGTYLTPEKLDVAIERLLAEL